MWIAVRQRFGALHKELLLSSEQRRDGIGKAQRVGQALQRAYDGVSTDVPPIIIVGSWGKKTQVSPSADIDVMMRFDHKVYERLCKRIGNKQSQFLQEVREHLLVSYPQTDIRGDGQVVAIGFDTITVEVVPVFDLPDARYLMPDTNAGGRWKIVDPNAQIRLIDKVDTETSGNTRALSRLIKLWKREQSVSIKSFLIELLVVEFMQIYPFRQCDYFWYDWFVRDFFRYLRTRLAGYVGIPGTQDTVCLGSDWAEKVEIAIKVAENACEWERLDLVHVAGDEWQKIFGNRVAVAIT